MNATFPTDLLLRFLQAPPEALAAIEPLLPPLPDGQQTAPAALAAPVPVAGSLPPRAPAGPAYVFRWNGELWEVVFDSLGPFYLENTLGAKYLDYLLHSANEPISSFDLEVAIQPAKGEARAINSIQDRLDGRARREYGQALSTLRAKRARAAGNPGELRRLEEEIQALESALKQGAGSDDTGERARGNVRRAIEAVLKQLDKRGPAERAFAAHLRSQVSTGYECQYSQPEGRVWG